MIARRRCIKLCPSVAVPLFRCAFLVAVLFGRVLFCIASCFDTELVCRYPSVACFFVICCLDAAPPWVTFGLIFLAQLSILGVRGKDCIRYVADRATEVCALKISA